MGIIHFTEIHRQQLLGVNTSSLKPLNPPIAASVFPAAQSGL